MKKSACPRIKSICINVLFLHKRDKKLSFVAQTPTPVQVTRGQKRYELSNHLGNVHTVLSDRKKTECSGNTFSAYEPEIINTYDYYPFGMLMEERKGQKPECTTSSSATTKTPYNYTFTWLTHDFIMYGTNVTVGSSGSALTVDRNSSLVASNWGTQKSGHSLVKGVTYTLSYQLQGAAPSGYTSTIGRTVQVRLKWGTSVMASGTLTLTSAMQSGSFNYTADYTGDYTIEIIYTGAGLNKGQFLADNVKITYNSQLTTVNCGTAEKYLYGFNGKEKIDEQYGIEGAAYDFGARLYDSRLGRWMASDPEPANFNAPYVFAQNSPAIMIDIDGKYEFFFNSETGRVYVTGTANSPNRYFVLNNNKGVGTAYRQVLNGSEIQERILSNVMAATLVSDNAKKGSDEWRMANRTLCDLNQSAVHDGRKKFLNHPATKTLGITLGIIITGGIIGEGLLAEMILETAAEEGFEYLTGVPLPIINDPADLLKLAKNWDNVVKNMPLCFVAGTKVKTAAGYKNIEDIVVGDLVWAFNDSTGQINLRRVENVVVKQATELILIDLGSEKIWTTPKHPFWLNNQWVEAKDLQVSDALTRFDGTLLTIKNILRVDSVTTVYNFAVEEYHTYYVTDLDILVHNDNPCSQGAKAGKDVIKTELSFNKGVVENFTEHAFAGGRHADLGLPLETMVSKGLNLVEQNKSLLKTGDNTLIGNINGIQKSFKAFVKDDKIMSVNMYPGTSNRVTKGTTINYGNVKW